MFQEPDGKTRRDELSRGQQMMRGGGELPPLELGPAEYLVDVMRDAGWVMQTAMGEQPLTWQEIVSYAQATEMISEPWEFRAMSQMSSAYLSGRHMGENPFSMHPNEMEL